MFYFNYNSYFSICKLYFCLKNFFFCDTLRMKNLPVRYMFMNFENQLKNLMQQINDFKATADNSLPQNTFYLNEKDDNGDGTIDEYIFYLRYSS